MPVTRLRLLGRVQTASLMGASVLASPTIPSALAAMLDLLDMAVTSLVVYQSLITSPVLGLQLSWLAIGCFVAVELPDLYPGGLSDLARPLGMRLLSAAVTVYFGVVVALGGGFNPPAVAFGVLPATARGALLFMLIGVAVGVGAFGLYYPLVRRQRVVDRDSPFHGLDLGADDGPDAVGLVDSSGLPHRIVRVLLTPFVVFILVAPCFLMGLACGVLNGFYPFPEILLFAGLAGSVIVRTVDTVPDVAVPDVESTILDAITDSFRNLKGIILTGWCLLALALVATVFFILGLTAATAQLEVWHGANWGSSFARMVQTAPMTWFGAGVAALVITFGGHGLVYWTQQLRRLPQYAEFWERTRDTSGRTQVVVPTGAVARPSGPYLSGLLLVAFYGVITGVVTLGITVGPMDAGQSRSLPDWLFVAIVNLGWPVVVGGVVWRGYRRLRNQPQSVRNEAREVLLALLCLLGGISVGFIIFIPQPLRTALVFVITGIAFALFTYLPEVTAFADGRDGLAGAIDLLYYVLIGGNFLLLCTLLGWPWIGGWTALAFIALGVVIHALPH